MSATKTTSEPWLTLAVLVHKPTPLYFEALLESCFKQPRDVFIDVIDDTPQPELWLVDKAEQLTRRCSNFRYLRHTGNKKGLSGNWNYAIDHARTDYVTVLHQDDVLRNKYVGIIESLINENPGVSAVFCHAEVMDPDGKKRFFLGDFVKTLLLKQFKHSEFLLSGEMGSRALMRGDFIFCPTVCFNRKRLNEHRFDSQWQMVPDLEFFTRLLLNGHEIAGSKQIGMRYRRHSEQATAQYQATGVRFDEEFRLYDNLACQYKDKGWHQAAKTAAQKRILKLHVLKDILVHFFGGRFAQAGNLMFYIKKAPSKDGAT